MKVLIILILMFAFNASADDFGCNNNLSSKYNFSYTIKNNNLEYKIESKNKEKIKYIYLEKYDFPNIVGFNVLGSNNKNPLNVLDNKIDLNNKKYKYLIFYEERENFYSINLLRGVLSQLIIQEENKNYKNYKESENLIGKIDTNKLTSKFQIFIPEENRYNEQKIKIKIKLALDPELNNCAEFETATFDYNLGSKFWYDIKSFFNVFNWDQ